MTTMTGNHLILALIAAAVLVDAWLWTTGRMTFSAAVRRWANTPARRLAVWAIAIGLAAALAWHWTN